MKLSPYAVKLTRFIKLRYRAAFPLDKGVSVEVKGRDLIYGLPKAIALKDEEIRQACIGMRDGDGGHSRSPRAHASGT